MSKLSLRITTLFIALLTTGCAYFSHDRVSQFPNQEKMCGDLRQQLIFQPDPYSPNNLSAPPTQNAQAMKDYYRYQCNTLEKNPSVQ